MQSNLVPHCVNKYCLRHVIQSILIVILCRSIFQRNVICSKSAQEAEHLMFDPHNIPDIIIADYRLPGNINGIQAISNVTAKLGYPVPAFIITGEADTSEVRKIADHGYRVLSKPVHPSKLRALISHLIQETNEASLNRDQLKVSVS